VVGFASGLGRTLANKCVIPGRKGYVWLASRSRKWSDWQASAAWRSLLPTVGSRGIPRTDASLSPTKHTFTGRRWSDLGAGPWSASRSRPSPPIPVPANASLQWSLSPTTPGFQSWLSTRCRRRSPVTIGSLFAQTWSGGWTGTGRGLCGQTNRRIVCFCTTTPRFTILLQTRFWRWTVCCCFTCHPTLPTCPPLSLPLPITSATCGTWRTTTPKCQTDWRTCLYLRPFPSPRSRGIIGRLGVSCGGTCRSWRDLGVPCKAFCPRSRLSWNHRSRDGEVEWTLGGAGTGGVLCGVCLSPIKVCLVFLFFCLQFPSRCISQGLVERRSSKCVGCRRFRDGKNQVLMQRGGSERLPMRLPTAVRQRNLARRTGWCSHPSPPSSLQ